MATETILSNGEVSHKECLSRLHDCRNRRGLRVASMWPACGLRRRLGHVWSVQTGAAHPPGRLRTEAGAADLSGRKKLPRQPRLNTGLASQVHFVGVVMAFLFLLT